MFTDPNVADPNVADPNVTTNATEHEWKDVPGHDTIEAHPCGDIRDKKTKRVFRVESKKHTYRMLTIDGHGTTVHRLVALTFCPNPMGLTQVNHIDGDKRNNASSNLSWSTPSACVLDSINRGRTEGRARSLPVRIFMKDGTTTDYPSITDASNAMGTDPSTLVCVLDKRGGEYQPRGSADVLWRAERIPLSVPTPSNPTVSVEEKNIDVDGFTHLVARSDGVIYNRKTKKAVGKTDGRHWRITSSKIDGKTHTIAAHQLIARMFIPNPDKKPNVNHIDGVTTNNSRENLEWTTQKENIQHAMRIGLINETTRRVAGDKLKVRVLQLELDGSVLKTFESVGSAGEEIQTNPSRISMICTEYRQNKPMEEWKDKTGAGYGWCFESDYRGLEINPALFDIFPELKERSDTSPIEFGKIRPSISRGARPVWQIEIDGTRMRLWDKILDACESIPNTSPKNIGACCKSNRTRLSGSYYWELATYEEIVDPNKEYQKWIPPPIRCALQIPEQDTRIIRPDVVSLLKQNIGQNGAFAIKTRPIVQMTIDGEVLRYWPSVSFAKNQLGYGRGCIDSVLAGMYKATGGYRWRWMTDDEILV